MKVLLLVIFSLFYPGCIAGLREYRSSVYVSAIRGINLRSCGRKTLPCKTLVAGLEKLAPGGQLYLDGKRTQFDPYSCESAIKFLVKSSSIQSYTTSAFISCPDGIAIKILPSVATKVYIRGITFKHTAITVTDTSIEFNNCNFVESSPLIVKVSKYLPLYYLTVNNSIFKENQGGVHIAADNTQNCNRVVMNFQNIIFQENQIISDGLITVQGTRTKKCTNVAVLSVWTNITVRNNTNRTQYSSKVSKSEISGSIFIVKAHTVQLEFNHVRSENNQNMRFLGVFCRQSNTYVYNSVFYGHKINKRGGVLHMLAVRRGHSVINVTLIESRFSSIVATHGAVLFVQKGSQRIVNLNMYNITVKNSVGSKLGCVFTVDKVLILNAKISGLDLSRCHDPCVRPICKKRLAGVCLNSVLKVHAVVQNSLFSNNFNGSVVYIHHKTKASYLHTGTLDVVLKNCTFIKNSSPLSSGVATFTVKVHFPQIMKRSHLSVCDSRFDKDKGGLNITNVEFINVQNVTCYGVKRFCISARMLTKRIRDFQNLKLVIADSIFMNSEMPLDIFIQHPKYLSIQIINSTFYKNDFDKVASISVGSVKKKGIYTSGKIILNGVRFLSNSLANSGGYLLGISAHHQGSIIVKIRRSLFKDNYQKSGISRTFNALIYFYMPNDLKQTSQVCTNFPVYRYNNTISFEGVTFKNNTGSLSLLYLSSGNTSFFRCRFKNNFSRHPMIAGNIYVEDQGTASLNITNSTFSQTKRQLKYGERLMQFVYAGAKGPLILKNSRFEFNCLTRMKSPLFTIQNGGSVVFNDNTDLLCPVGSSMIFENLSRAFQPNVTRYQCPSQITRLKYTCMMCAKGFYSLQRGSFHGSTMTTKSTNCLPCPFGGNCTWRIKSDPNFWGYVPSKNPPKLKFTRCPEKYCKPPRFRMKSIKYNSCYGNRSGIMCGSCKRGFTESMFNRNCRVKNECKDGWFWVIAGIYSTVMAIHVMYRPSLGNILIEKVFWFKKKRRVPSGIDLLTSSEHKENNGYSKIIFYFYQIAQLLSLQPSHEVLVLKEYLFLRIIISFYNFEIDRIDAASGCPFPGLNAVTKELFRSLQVFAAMAIVIVFYFLQCLVCYITAKPRPRPAAYIASVTEILLLGYERLARTSLELLNCRPLSINGHTKWVLFLDGNITCWVHWWQFALISYNIIFVVPFLVVLLKGTSKLRRQEISALQFVAACFLPLPFLLHWLCKSCRGRTHHTPEYFSRNHETAEALIQVIEGPFRSSNSKLKGTLYWESVLIGRRLVFLCLFAFVTTPMLRLFVMTILCVVILMHNIYVMPYKNNKINTLTFIFLFMHVVIASTNLCKSVLITDGIVPKSPMNALIHGLQMMSIVLLVLPPCAFLLLLGTALASQIVRMLMLFCLFICHKTKHSEQPLEFINSDSSQPLLSEMQDENCTSINNK